MTYEENIKLKIDILSDIYDCIEGGWGKDEKDIIHKERIQKCMRDYEMQLKGIQSTKGHNEIVIIDEPKEEECNDFEKRLCIIANVLNVVCVEGGCGYDLKELLRKIIFGIIKNEEDAIKEWQAEGWKIF